MIKVSLPADIVRSMLIEGITPRDIERFEIVNTKGGDEDGTQDAEGDK